MDCSTADLPANMASESPGSSISGQTEKKRCNVLNSEASIDGKDNSSCDEDDFVPLSKLLMRPQSEEKKSRDGTESLTSSPNKNSERDEDGEDNSKPLDGSSDDEPLIKKKKAFSPAAKQSKKESTPHKSNVRENKKAGSNSDDDSDNEPLIKITKASSKAEKNISVTPKKSVNRKKKVPQESDESSDEEPLSEDAKKRHSRHKRKASAVPLKEATPVIKSKREAARKNVKYCESSSEHTSDDKPLATIKKKRTDTPKQRKVSSNKKSEKKGSSSLDSSSDDDEDDVPLVNIVGKNRKPATKTTKKSNVSRSKKSKKRQELLDESSDDEPLVNIMKRNPSDKQTKKKTKASPHRRERTPKKSRNIPAPELSSSSSDSEAVSKTPQHPQVTKILRIVLERCDAGGTGSMARLEETTTGETQVADKPTKEDSEESVDSSEE